MSLKKGQKLGPYEIDAPAGAGGMGEVYKATDTRLGRTVAIKVLPPQSALNPDSRARFEREARTISSLNHPNICTLHDIGHENGIDFLVMELLEGESLADRLSHGKLDTVKALEIGSQIAGALEAAHRKGVVHRDLKPGNIFLTRDGAKLLDFGLAKLQAEAVTGLDDETRTTPVTGAGAIVGTLQYMSPEQLEGNEADARSDIFAFGATVYEMLTGQRAFTGESKASLIGSIMKDEPRSIAELQPTSPPALDRLIRKCLAKDPDDRWQSAKDLKDELDWIASSESQAGIPAPVASKRRFRVAVAWSVASLCTLIALMLGWQQLTRKNPQPQSFRFTIPKPEGVVDVDWPQISPDGRYLAFLGFDSLGTSQIWIRPLADPEAYPLPSTTVSTPNPQGRPFWSPDSKSLAFYDAVDGCFKKVSIEGGPPTILFKADGADGTWGTNGTILFDDFMGVGIGKASISGGEPAIAVIPDSMSGEKYVSWPCFLPDGRHFVYNDQSLSWASSTDDFILKAGSIDNNETKVIGKIGVRAIYCEPGYLMYLKNGFLVMHKFDTGSLELKGDPVPITEMAISSSRSAGMQMNASASQNGIIAWKKGPPRLGQLVWVDRNGQELDTIGEPAIYGDIKLSPDNRYVAYHGRHSEAQDFRIGVIDLKSGRDIRVTANGYQEFFPVWSPDESAIAFTGYVGSDTNTIEYCRLGNASSRRLAVSDSSEYLPLLWSSSNILWVGEYPAPYQRNRRILKFDLAQSNPPEFYFEIPEQLNPRDISSDDRYLLCQRYIGIRRPIFYVYDMTTPGLRWRITENGDKIKWSPMGNEIFYFNDDKFMVVSVNLEDGFNYDTPRMLFTRQLWIDFSITRWGYDISSDGQKFLFVTPVSSPGDSTGDIEVVVNWQTEFGVK